MAKQPQPFATWQDLKDELSTAFEAAVEARDQAQSVIERIQEIRRRIQVSELAGVGFAKVGPNIEEFHAEQTANR